MYACTSNFLDTMHDHNNDLMTGNTTVVFKDPDALEMVLRAEGKYPQRDLIATPRLKWIIEKGMKVSCPIGFE